MTYTLKFRQHVLALKKKEALTYAETADRFGVGSASLMRWAKRLEPCLTRNKPACIFSSRRLPNNIDRDNLIKFKQIRE